MPVIRTPEERFKDLPGYPFKPHYMEINGMRIHYVDEDKGGEVAGQIMKFIDRTPVK
jgi:haloalkane dehalogenase